MCLVACQKAQRGHYPERTGMLTSGEISTTSSRTGRRTHVQRLDTIDSSLKELIYQLLDTGFSKPMEGILFPKGVVEGRED
jgi:hypothetical protein